MALVACGLIGFGDWICEVERGRPFGMSAVARDSRRELEELFDDDLLEELDLEDDLEEDLLEDEEEDLEEDLEEEEEEEEELETSRMFRTRPVVGSVVEDSEGLWDTW